MSKLTIADLQRIKESHKSKLTLREGGCRAKVTVHMGTCGIALGARKVMKAVLDDIAEAGLTDIIVTTSGCAGLCAREPIAAVEIINGPTVRYCDLDGLKMREIFRRHILGGTPVERYALAVD